MKDKMDRRSSFTVIASADNCSVSTHPLLTPKSGNLLRFKFVDTELMDSSVTEVKHKSVSSTTSGTFLNVSFGWNSYAIYIHFIIKQNKFHSL